LSKYNQEFHEKSPIKVSAYFALEKEEVEKVIKSLCTKSRGFVSLKAFPRGKKYWCYFPKAQPANTLSVKETLIIPETKI